MGSGEVILETTQVKKEFDGLVAVNGVSYSLHKGEVAGIIGPNGAGKSTFFNLLTGLYPPTDGQVFYQGKDITNVPSFERVKFGLVRTFQLVAVFDSLSVIENLVLSNIRFREAYSNKFQFFFGNARRAQIKELCYHSLEMVGIIEKADLEVSKLSYGDKRKLEIAVALSLNPAILLLDEPFAGLSDTEIDDVLNLIDGIKDNFSVVLIEHKISKLVHLVNRLSVMHEGKLIADGLPNDILNDSVVRRVYWGEKECQSS